MEEIWKTLIYQQNEYQKFEVSNNGNLRNANTKKIYSKYLNHQGYYQVCVSLGSRHDKKVFKIHRAVAETFIPNKEYKPTINHIDGNKLNNNINNLEWATYSENTIHAVNNGLIIPLQGTQKSQARFSRDEVKYIRKNYIPKDEVFGCCALAKKFGVHHSAISNIVNYKSYKDVV